VTDILKVVVPATIALIGTILTIWFGYHQWKRQQDAARSGTYVTEKQSAYKELWVMLENVHIKLRTDEVSQQEFRILVLEVNSYILRQSLYLDDYDRELSNQYLKAVRRMKEAVLEFGDEESEFEAVTTGAMPAEVITFAKEYRESVRQVDQLRGKLVERFRTIVRGT